MIKNISLRVSPEIAYSSEELKKYLIDNGYTSSTETWNYKINKRSIDARKRDIIINLGVNIYIDEPVQNLSSFNLNYNKISTEKTVHIIGSGPAGLFAALACIENNLKPIIYEQGKDVKARRRDLAAISKQHIVNPYSNYCYGEGGAGTYSDGKLYTRSGKRGSIEKILNILVHHGATEDILIDTHPHIGTNKLPKIIEAIRNTILHCGGEFYFNHKLVDFKIKNEKINELQILNIETNKTLSIESNNVILATGHSARDIFELLHSKKITLEAKTFALGVRIEHPQPLIDAQQYHCNNINDVENKRLLLPAASYNWVEQVEGNGVYSFCMCPGGIIAPCATYENEIVTNGWSPSKRNNPYANSGVVTTVDEKLYSPFLKHGPLAALRYQQMVEKKCYEAANHTQAAPAQRLIDFCNNKKSKDLPPCSYQPGLTNCNLHDVLPKEIALRIKKALLQLAKKMPAYYTNDAVIVAPESRTSSPVRIPRDKIKYHHTEITNLYPCAEGAGYAGGIISAAIDGDNCVQAILTNELN